MVNLLQKMIADKKNSTPEEWNQPKSRTSNESRESSIDEEVAEFIAQLLKRSENGALLYFIQLQGACKPLEPHQSDFKIKH